MKPRPLKGEILVPGDKSLTHRALMFGSMAWGETVIRSHGIGRDNLSTARVMGQLGVEITGTLSPAYYALAREERLSGFSEGQAIEIRVRGRGVEHWRDPEAALDCGNSGTTARLLMGCIGGSHVKATFVGDESLSKRPFKRIAEPLRLMGATVDRDVLPVTVAGARQSGTAHAISYSSPRSSAQVKSAVLLAGLGADGVTTVTEPFRSRDHTERMLTAMGVHLDESAGEGGTWSVSLTPPNRRELSPLNVTIPGDLSGAAFFISLGLLTPGSELRVRGVGVNPTRTGFLSILARMGARVGRENERLEGGEPVADLVVSPSDLRGVDISAEEVAYAIDEIPILAVCMAFARGESRISGAEELRVKESDRLQMMAALLSSRGAEVEEFPDGLRIAGGLAAGEGYGGSGDESLWERSLDHRILMSRAVLDYALSGSVLASCKEVVETSFPGFFETLARCG